MTPAFINRFLAGQFANPHGLLGRWVVTPLLNRIGRRLNDLAFRLVEPRPGETVLEIGYGGGGLLRRLSKQGLAELVGVDRSSAVPHRIPGAILVQADAQALPFARGGFDAVVSVSVLHFWSDLRPSLAEIARVIRPGGRLVLVFEPPEALQRWPGHVHGFCLWEVEDVIEAAELADLHLEERQDGRGIKPDFFVGLRFRKGTP